MRKYVYHILIVFLFQLHSLKGQYQNVYSNYILNMAGINPAAIGKEMALDVNVCSRKQWNGFNGSPFTNYVSVNTMMRKPSVNVGILVQSDKIAVSSNQSICGMYAYRVKIKKVYLALGLQAGVQFSNTDLSQLKRTQEGDALVTQNQNRTVNFVSGTGIYLHGKSFFAGASSPLLYKSGKSFNIHSTPILLNFGLVLKAGKTDLVKPSVMLRRMKGSEMTTDLNLTYYFYSKYGIGFSYRVNNAVVALMEIVLKDQFKISYCYDYSTSSLARYQNGSHEISLRYLFGKQYNIKNPRALIH